MVCMSECALWYSSRQSNDWGMTDVIHLIRSNQGNLAKTVCPSACLSVCLSVCCLPSHKDTQQKHLRDGHITTHLITHSLISVFTGMCILCRA